MQGSPKDNSTGRREAYFIDFARECASIAKVPIMVTGGIVRREVAENAMLPDGSLPAVDMLGVATALAYYPDLPNQWQQGNQLEVSLPKLTWKNTTLAALGTMALTKYQLHLASLGKPCKPSASPVLAIIRDRIKAKKQTARYKKWRAKTQ